MKHYETLCRGLEGLFHQQRLCDLMLIIGSKRFVGFLYVLLKRVAEMKRNERLNLA